MKEYFISVIAISLIGGMIVSLLPDGNSVKNVKLLCSLCVVACMVFPLASFFSGTVEKDGIVDMFEIGDGEADIYDEIYNDSLNQYELINAEKSLKQEIIQRFSASYDAFDLKIITDKNNDVIYIATVDVHIYNSGLSISPRAIEKYVYDRLGCECNFIYEII